MLRLFLTALLISLGTAAQTFPTGTDLRAMAYAGDVAAIDDAMATAQAEVVAGTATPDQLRLLVTELTGTDPVLLAFSETWVAEMPTSPYGHTIRAWQLYLRSFDIRGSQTVQWVWPPAMDLFQQAQWEGMEHAVTAYQLDPDLIPASDAILRMQKTTKLIPTMMFARFFEEIMSNHQDYGTLNRALSLTDPKWGGGGLPALEGLCRTHAGQVRDVEGFTVEICILDGVFNNGLERHEMGHYEDLVNHQSPLLIHQRARFLLQRGDWDQIDWLRDYIQTNQPDNVFTARDFDNTFARPGGEPPMAHYVLEEARQVARDVLSYAPYNRSMLEVMLMRDRPSSIGWSYPTEGIVTPLTEEERLGYTFDTVMAAPYEESSWLVLSNFTTDAGDRPYFLPAWSNAIAYTNHNPSTLARYVHDLSNRYHALQRQTDGGNMTAAELIAAQRPVLCEVVRGDRITDAVCDAVGHGTYGCGGINRGGYIQPDRIADLIAEAQTGGVCQHEFSSDINDLIYEPVSIPRP